MTSIVRVDWLRQCCSDVDNGDGNTDADNFVNVSSWTVPSQTTPLGLEQSHEQLILLGVIGMLQVSWVGLYKCQTK